MVVGRTHDKSCTLIRVQNIWMQHIPKNLYANISNICIEIGNICCFQILSFEDIRDMLRTWVVR